MNRPENDMSSEQKQTPSGETGFINEKQLLGKFQSVVARWAIGKLKGSYLISRSADVACMTGRVCKARSYAGSGEESCE